MSYSIFIANPTALIAQPGRAVNTFPSGLVRVDQVYLGLTSQAAANRATLALGNNMPDGDSSPCIDGLKIFPEVQERRREDGFTEFIVSAYGRANASGKINTGLQLNTLAVPTYALFSPLPPNVENPTRPFKISSVVATNVVTKSIAVPAATEIDSILFPAPNLNLSIVSTNIDAIKDRYEQIGFNATYELSNLNLVLSIVSEFAGLTRANYGAFDEVTISIAGNPYVTASATLTINS